MEQKFMSRLVVEVVVGFFLSIFFHTEYVCNKQGIIVTPRLLDITTQHVMFNCVFLKRFKACVKSFDEVIHWVDKWLLWNGTEKYFRDDSDFSQVF